MSIYCDVAAPIRRSPRPVRSVFADRDKQSGDRLVRVCGMPRTRWVDRIFSRPKLVRLLRSVRQLLVQGHMSLDAAHDLIARGVRFPARPALLEPEKADQASFLHVAGVPLLIILVPFEARELRLRDGA